MANYSDYLDALKELEYKQKEETRTIKAELSSARVEIQELRAERETVDTPEEYKRKTADIKEREQYIDFLNTRLNGPSVNSLSDAELKKIVNEGLHEAEAIRDALRPKMEKLVNQLIPLVAEYADAIEEINNVVVTARRINGTSQNRLIYNYYLTEDTDDVFKRIMHEALNHYQYMKNTK